MSLLNLKLTKENFDFTLSSKKLISFSLFALSLVFAQVSSEAFFLTSILGVLIFFNNDRFLSFLFFTLALTASNDVTLGGAFVCCFIILTLIVSKNELKPRLNAMEFSSLFLLFFYMSLTCFFVFFDEIDFLYIDYFKRNIYKEFILPLLIILCFILYRFTGVEYLKALFYASCFFTFTQIICVLVNYEINIHVGTQFSLSLIVLFFVKSIKYRFFAILNVSVYLYILVSGYVYFSSQDVMLVILVLVLYLMFYKRFWLVCLSIVFLSLFLLGKSLDVHSFLKNTLELESVYAFKLGQVFMVLQSVSFADIPWSPRVRLVELINTFDRSVFEIVFGSGLVSYINTDYISFIHNNYDVLGADDFHQLEISSDRFYGLHNTSRGLLHYGLVYFLFATYLFNYNFKKSLQCSDPSLLKVSNLYLYILAIWNPNIVFIFLLATLKRIGNKNEF
jgi:hypothetical protein